MRLTASRHRLYRKSVRDLIAISKKVAADENALDKDPESMSKKEH